MLTVYEQAPVCSKNANEQQLRQKCQKSESVAHYLVTKWFISNEHWINFFLDSLHKMFNISNNTWGPWTQKWLLSSP